MIATSRSASSIGVANSSYTVRNTETRNSFKFGIHFTQYTAIWDCIKKLWARSFLENKFKAEFLGKQLLFVTIQGYLVYFNTFSLKESLTRTYISRGAAYALYQVRCFQDLYSFQFNAEYVSGVLLSPRILKCIILDRASNKIQRAPWLSNGNNRLL